MSKMKLMAYRITTLVRSEEEPKQKREKVIRDLAECLMHNNLVDILEPVKTVLDYEYVPATIYVAKKVDEGEIWRRNHH